MTLNDGNWFIRKNGHVTGPFSSAVINNHLTVGRVSKDDEISTNEKDWLPISAVAELCVNESKAELDNARRQLDERTGLDRRAIQTPFAEHLAQRKGERRQQEPAETARHRKLRRMLLEKAARQRKLILWPLLITFVGLIVVAVIAIRFPTMLPVPMPNCNAEAAPQVNWENCLKPKAMLNGVDLSQAQLRNSRLTDVQLMNSKLDGADMSYANLQFGNLSYSSLKQARLLGANLNHADLSYADLQGADLSFADLTDSNLGQANLHDVKLGNAIWVNGQICAEGSVGQCLPTK